MIKEIFSGKPKTSSGCAVSSFALWFLLDVAKRPPHLPWARSLFTELAVLAVGRLHELAMLAGQRRHEESK